MQAPREQRAGQRLKARKPRLLDVAKPKDQHLAIRNRNSGTCQSENVSRVTLPGPSHKTAIDSKKQRPVSAEKTLVA